MAGELWTQSASTLAAMIARRETTSRAVVEAHLARIEAVNPAVNAVVSVDADGARAAADAADRSIAAGAPLGVFHGVPFTVKTNIDQIGVPTTHAVVALAGSMPTSDDPTVERMKAAGAIPIARTNMPDMGLRLHTDNALFGLTRNPWNLGRTVGGSSGGEGAALAAGMTPIGLGNDIGGSLRNPAFACGIASLKPSFGRIATASSIEPHAVPLTFQLMAVHGPMARSVGDLRVALAVLAGPHPRDPLSFPAPLVGPAPARRKVAVMAEPPGGSTAPEIANSVRLAADALADAGYEVTEIAPPQFEDAVLVWRDWLCAELAVQAPVLRTIMSRDAVTFLDDMLAEAGEASFAQSVEFQMHRHRIATAWSQFLAEYPLILGPTWCQPQFEHGYDVAGPGSARNIINLMRNVVPLNLLGLPAVCVPAGVANGLPLGVQIAGDRFREDLCLDAAEAIEARLGVLTPIDPRG